MSRHVRRRREHARNEARRRRRLVGLTAVAAVAVAAGIAWWSSGSAPPPPGTPRLVVDRTEIELGALRFETPATASFTLTNAGGGVLTLDPSPRVRAVVGC